MGNPVEAFQWQLQTACLLSCRGEQAHSSYPALHLGAPGLQVSLLVCDTPLSA